MRSRPFILPALFLVSASTWSTAAPAQGPGPSFDCAKVAAARDPVALTICSDAGLARLDLEMAQAYYAFRHQLPEGDRGALRAEGAKFHQSVVETCGLPKPGSPAAAPAPAAVPCISAAYRRRKAELVGRLAAGPAQEAQREPAENVGLQRRLQGLGYLPADAVPDGVFGPATRAAIAGWQQEENLQATGFLDAASAQRLARSTTAAAPPPAAANAAPVRPAAAPPVDVPAAPSWPAVPVADQLLVEPTGPRTPGPDDFVMVGMMGGNLTRGLNGNLRSGSPVRVCSRVTYGQIKRFWPDMPGPRIPDYEQFWGTAHLDALDDHKAFERLDGRDRFTTILAALMRAGLGARGIQVAPDGYLYQPSGCEVALVLRSELRDAPRLARLAREMSGEPENLTAIFAFTRDQVETAAGRLAQLLKTQGAAEGARDAALASGRLGGAGFLRVGAAYDGGIRRGYGPGYGPGYGHVCTAGGDAEVAEQAVGAMARTGQIMGTEIRDAGSLEVAFGALKTGDCVFFFGPADQVGRLQAALKRDGVDAKLLQPWTDEAGLRRIVAGIAERHRAAAAEQARLRAEEARLRAERAAKEEREREEARRWMEEKRAAEARCQADAACRAQREAEAERERKRLYVELTCRMGRGMSTMMVHQCFADGRDHAAGSLRIRSGGETRAYSAMDFNREFLRREVRVPLEAPFSITAQANGNEYSVLVLKIVNGVGEVLFQDETTNYGVIRTPN